MMLLHGCGTPPCRRVCLLLARLQLRLQTLATLACSLKLLKSTLGLLSRTLEHSVGRIVRGVGAGGTLKLPPRPVGRVDGEGR